MLALIPLSSGLRNWPKSRVFLGSFLLSLSFPWRFFPFRFFAVHFFGSLAPPKEKILKLYSFSISQAFCDGDEVVAFFLYLMTLFYLSLCILGFHAAKQRDQWIQIAKIGLY